MSFYTRDILLKQLLLGACGLTVQGARRSSMTQRAGEGSVLASSCSA